MGDDGDGDEGEDAMAIPTLFTAREGAQVLRVNVRVVYEIVEAGEIEHTPVDQRRRSIRIAESALAAYIARVRTPAKWAVAEAAARAVRTSSRPAGPVRLPLD